MTFFDTKEIKKMDTVERDFYFQELSESNKKDSLYRMSNRERAKEIQAEFSATFPKMELWLIGDLGEFFTFGDKSKNELIEILKKIQAGHEKALSEICTLLKKAERSED